MDVASVVKRIPDGDYDVWDVTFSFNLGELRKRMQWKAGNKNLVLINKRPVDPFCIWRIVTQAERDIAYELHGDKWRDFVSDKESNIRTGLSEKIIQMMYPDEPS